MSKLINDIIEKIESVEKFDSGYANSLKDAWTQRIYTIVVAIVRIAVAIASVMKYRIIFDYLTSLGFRIL